jgi:hypothetical protein
MSQSQIVMIKRHGRIASSMPIERFSMSATLTSPAGCAEHCVSSACKAPFEAAKHVREKSFKEELCKKSMKFTFVLDSSDGDMEEQGWEKTQGNKEAHHRGGTGRKTHGGWKHDAHVKLEEVGEMVWANRHKGDCSLLEQAAHHWQREETALNDASDREADDEERHAMDCSKAWWDLQRLRLLVMNKNNMSISHHNHCTLGSFVQHQSWPRWQLPKAF